MPRSTRSARRRSSSPPGHSHCESRLCSLHRAASPLSSRSCPDFEAQISLWQVAFSSAFFRESSISAVQPFRRWGTPRSRSIFRRTAKITFRPEEMEFFIRLRPSFRRRLNLSFAPWRLNKYCDRADCTFNISFVILSRQTKRWYIQVTLDAGVYR